MIGEWTRPKRCDVANCVEVRDDGDGVFLRESDAPNVVVGVSPASWDAFVDAVKRGEFDRTA